MYDPEGNNSGHSKWIELYNPTSEEIIFKKETAGIIDEEKLELDSDGKKYKNCHRISDDIKVAPKKFVIISSNDNDFKNDYPDTSDVYDSAFDLSPSEGYIRLSNDKCETFFHKLEFDNSWGGKNNGRTLEKISLEEPGGKSNWQESYITGGTPGKINSEKPEPKSYPSGIHINEILPNPNGSDEENEYIELHNSTRDDIDLYGWILEDKSSGRYVFPKESILKAKDFLIIYRKDFSFAINNSNESINLLNPNEESISKASFSDSAKESYSYSFDGSAWRWTSKLTPGVKNEFDPVLSGKVKKDKDIYVNIYANFEANAVHEKAKKFTWDFGDSHKSYLEKTRHKYEKTGKYQASLKITGEGEEALYSFEVEVKKYPQSKVRIKNASPNPKGKDTDNEWIEIENKTKKKINLKGWSIATGWKNLYNHPIKKDFVIKKGETKKLTRKICAFTLNNEKTKLELRSPDGKVAQKIKYNRKNNKIEEDEIFEINGKDEAWTKPPGETEEQNDTETDSKNTPNQMKEESNNSEEKTPGADIQIDQAELEASLGRYSPNPAWERKQKNKIMLANLGVSIKPKIIFASAEGQVLGVEKTKSAEKYYSFTDEPEEKHWAEKLIDGLWKEINFGLNWIINQI